MSRSRLFSKLASQYLEEHCDIKQFLKNAEEILSFPLDLPCCWICWVLITNNDIRKWRKTFYCNPFYKPVAPCPICGYQKWKGSAWYPVLFVFNKTLGFIDPSCGVINEEKYPLEENP